MPLPDKHIPAGALLIFLQATNFRTFQDLVPTLEYAAWRDVCICLILYDLTSHDMFHSFPYLLVVFRNQCQNVRGRSTNGILHKCV